MRLLHPVSGLLLAGALLLAGCSSTSQDPAPSPSDTGPASTSDPIPSTAPVDTAPTDTPDAQPEWPQTEPDTRLENGGIARAAVVWVEVVPGGQPTDSLDPIKQELQALGYESPLLPLSCQHEAYAALGIPESDSPAWGAGLVFAERADADRFVELYGKPVRGIVEANAFCDFG